MKRFTFILALVMSMLSFTNAKADKLSIRSGESSIYAYQTYSIENAFDGKYATKFWTSDSPKAGYTFTVYLGSSVKVGDIKLYFDNGDLPADGTVIEVDENNSGNWIQVGEPLTGIQANDVVTRNAGGVYTKQIRLRFTQASAYWFRLLEFEVYEYEVAIQERTISAVAGEGGSVTINGGSDAVTSTEKVQLVATPDYGYKFVRWTVGGEEVSTSAEYTDNTDGNKEYVAVFEKFASTDEWYASIGKPTFAEGGGTHLIAGVEFNGENLSGFNYTKGTTSSFQNDAFSVVPGETYSLTLTYELHWGDIALYQIDCDGTEKKYGYYTCQWEANGDPYAILGRNEDLMCEEFGVENFAALEHTKSGETNYIELPYEITVSENHKPGDLIVVRAMIDKGDNGAYGQGIREGGCFDILFVVAEDTSEWSTFYQPYPVALLEGVNAYIVTAAASDYVTLTRFEGTIPANTAVILNNGEPKGEAVDVDFSTNLLEGTTVDTYIHEEAYVLSKVDGEVGFYKAEMTDGTWLNNATKAYLPANTVPNKSAAFYGFDWDGTTGISEVKGESGNVKGIYDLTGRRVEAITAPGIYIIDGVKRVVR
ncbi:MAG: discoidin domain-containing protein [Bacteroidaceae bacterium]|nr:discoidin domain-containing protein [Bacteroidaceae bacterium]